MNYKETIEFLYSQLPQYQKVGGKALKSSLDNIKALCQMLDNPQDKIKTIHIAGTNGKGSTTSMLASILKEQGYRVGVFTSPHLLDFRERISINGVEIPKQYVVDFVEQYKDKVQKIYPSFFEWTMALAFDFFYKENVDVALIETGLGGRLDSSNIITPLLSIITTIGIDHTQYLGNTYTQIAYEKGGIIKENVPVVVGYGLNEEALNEIQRIAKQKKADLYIAKPLSTLIKTDLEGTVQQYNVATVIKAVDVLKKRNLLSISEEAVNKGLLNVMKNTLLRGRWEVVQRKPKIILDIAHNHQAVERLVEQIGKEKFSKLYIIWGMMKDKEVERIVDLLPGFAEYHLCSPGIERAMPGEELQTFFQSKNYEVHNSCEEAFVSVASQLTKEDVLLISGSNFVVSEVVNLIKQKLNEDAI